MELRPEQVIYWNTIEFEQWPLVLAATPTGLCYVGSEAQFTAWTAKSHFKTTQWEQNEQIILPYATQFSEYLHGERTQFTIPIDYIGTEFQKSIWDALLEIPFGATCSYSDIAESIQRPQAVRAVGTAIGANPVLIAVPCHRVIGKNSTLTGFRSGLEMKARLLQLEGLTISNVTGKAKLFV